MSTTAIIVSVLLAAFVGMVVGFIIGADRNDTTTEDDQ